MNALLATVSTDQVAPVIAAQRLRKGAAGSPRGATRLATDTLALILRTCLAGRAVLVRGDAALYSHAVVTACCKAGARVSITVRMDPAVKRAIAAIGDEAWTAFKYTDALYDEQTGQWISRAEVAEVPFTAFTSKKPDEQIPGWLVVRRIPDLNPKKDQGGPRCSISGVSTPSSPPWPPASVTPWPPTRFTGPRDHRERARRPEGLGPGAHALR